MRAAVIVADDNPTDSVMHIGNINGFELKSFIDECFQMKSVGDIKLLPGYRRIVDRIYHNIADGGISIGSMSLHQMVSQTLTHLDAVLKPIWHLLFANYMDLHSKHSDADDVLWWEKRPNSLSTTTHCFSRSECFRQIRIVFSNRLLLICFAELFQRM